MEFSEKLQKLRKKQNLTQEELAEKLYVSRTAISKWESGRGYPSIDSLKVIAKYFHITIDELIGGEEIVTLAEQDIKENNKKHTALICSVLDCFAALLLFMPLFGNGDSSGASVTMFSLTEVSEWLKIVFIAIIGLTVLNGFCGVIISNFDKPVWNKHRLISGIVLSITGTILFIVTRQPYAGVFFLFVLVIKGFLLLKSK
ncbi:MAG: helix-turn-helix transcriptional regulator [Ruminococcus sp.]|nr:helix-turn-helix transcriptional regulator [Ruminococcus sp.]